MKPFKANKFICGLLAISFSISLMGCGKSDKEFTDYGSTEAENISQSEPASSSNAMIVEPGSNESLQKTYGTSKKKWEDSFKVNGINFEVDAEFEIPDIEGLNVYNMQIANDGKANEDQIVKALFGDTGKKIEELKYVNETDYISLMYKYREIINYTDFINHFEETQDFTSDIFDRTVINSSYTETFRWLDETDLYIHMYEGDYEGHKFGLLLAYDYKSSTKYIFFEPISIHEYFPNNDFKSLIVTDSVDGLGQDMEIENACTDNIDAIKNNAQNFLSSKLMISGAGEIINNPTYFMLLNHDNLASFLSTSYEFINHDIFNHGNSVLMFSNVDYYSTLQADTHVDKVDYSILADQKDIYSDYKKAHTNTAMSIYDTLQTYSGEINSMTDEPEFTNDGYAVYLMPDYGSVGNHINAYTLCPDNTGTIKYTSQGLYSVDLEIHSEELDRVENVKLLDLDNIIESFKAEIHDYYDPDKLSSTKGKVTVSFAYLQYYPYFGNEKNALSFSYVPVWVFEIIGDTPVDMGIAYVNAIDGTILDVNQEHYYEE